MRWIDAVYIVRVSIVGIRLKFTLVNLEIILVIDKFVKIHEEECLEIINLFNVSAQMKIM